MLPSCVTSTLPFDAVPVSGVADLSQADFYCRPSCRGQSVKGSMDTASVQIKAKPATARIPRAKTSKVGNAQ